MTSPQTSNAADLRLESEIKDSASHLAEGIRFLALKKYADASESLSHAVEALTEKHGEMAPETADALVLYGKALLGNAIAQSAVLGGGPDGQPAEQTEAAVQNAVAGPSSGPAATAANWKFSFGGDAPDDEEDEDGEEGEEGQGEDEDGEGGGDAAIDRDDELENAFISLDMARAIFEKMEGDEAKQKRADVHKLLGEVAQESEQFDNAVDEYQAALDILTRILPPYNRALSELHMLIALALDNLPDSVDKAVKHAELAKDVLLLKIEQLDKLEKKTEKDAKEIADIKDLMGDLDMKIEDLKCVPVEAPKTEAEKRLDELLKGAAANGAASSGVVNNLNSLVKKKAKPAATEADKPVIEPKAETVAPPPEVAPEEDLAETSKGKRKAAEALEAEDEKKVKSTEMP